jgi:hypothetical protein
MRLVHQLNHVRLAAVSLGEAADEAAGTQRKQLAAAGRKLKRFGELVKQAARGGQQKQRELLQRAATELQGAGQALQAASDTCYQLLPYNYHDLLFKPTPDASFPANYVLLSTTSLKVSPLAGLPLLAALMPVHCPQPTHCMPAPSSASRPFLRRRWTSCASCGGLPGRGRATLAARQALASRAG